MKIIVSCKKYESYENHRIQLENYENLKILEFHERFKKFMKILEFHMRIKKIMKSIEFHSRIPKLIEII